MQYPYLGVTISDDLRWNLHVDGVLTKATWVLNFLCRNISRCPLNAKAVCLQDIGTAKIRMCCLFLGPLHHSANIVTRDGTMASSTVCQA